jgi:outer membrane murein-binding lipoprotein Lpp
MNTSNRILGAAMIVALLFAGCAKKEQGPVESAVEKTKDALDMREHEKLKDAAEDAKAAVTDAAEGIKDAAKETTQEVKQAAKDAQGGN